MAYKIDGNQGENAKNEGLGYIHVDEKTGYFFTQKNTIKSTLDTLEFDAELDNDDDTETMRELRAELEKFLMEEKITEADKKQAMLEGDTEADGLMDKITKYDGENVWGDVIGGHDDVDWELTDWVDMSGRSDYIRMSDGSELLWSEETGEWSAR